MSRILFEFFDDSGGSIITTAGTAVGTSTTAANFTATASFSGIVAGTSTATANLSATGRFSGTANGTSTANAILTAIVHTSGSTNGVATAAAVFTAAGRVAGTAAGTATTAGTFTATATVAGSAAGTSTAAAAGSLISNISGSADGVSTAAATLNGVARFAGGAAGTSIVDAILAATGSVSGSAVGTSTAVAHILAILSTIDTSGSAAGHADVRSVITALYPPGYVWQGSSTVRAATPGPLREYYLRTRNGVLEGPYTYYEAETKARTSTREAARTGVGDISRELVTIVGQRQGDPKLSPSIDRVVCVYLAGRKTVGGDLAQYNHDRGNT